MPARLILNADDFGLTAGINRSIEELHRAGVLSSATLMANGSAFDDGVAVARRNPRLGVGCHIVLVDGLPISPPSAIPSLIGPDGKSFRSSFLTFTRASLAVRLRKADILTEALAQIRKLQASGIAVTHLDTHKHTHLLPVVNRPLLEAATASGIHAIRNPFEQPWNLSLHHGTSLRRLQIRLLNTLQSRFLALPSLHAKAILTTRGTVGISATGYLDANLLQRLFQHLPSKGDWELVCHPGHSDPELDRVTTRLRKHRECEHAALLDLVPQLLSKAGAPKLIHFGDLVSGSFTAAAPSSM